MTDLVHDFFSMPLWFTIPLVVIYTTLLGYFIYTLWFYRHNKSLLMLVFVFTIALSSCTPSASPPAGHVSAGKLIPRN